MTPQSSLQGRIHVLALFAHGGEIATNASESNRTVMTSEGARDFLLDFHHANILFGEVIVERDSQVFQARPNRLLVFAQVTQQIVGGMLFRLASLPFWGRDGGMKQIPFIQQRQETGFPDRDEIEVKRGQSLSPSPIRKIF